MLDRRSTNRPEELAIPAAPKIGVVQKHMIRIVCHEPNEPESPSIEFGDFKSTYRIYPDIWTISGVGKKNSLGKESEMLDLPHKERLLSIIPETKSALEDQSQIASVYTQSPTSPPSKEQALICKFAEVKPPKDENTSEAEYPVSAMLDSLLNPFHKEYSKKESPQETNQQATKNLKVKEPFGQLSSRLQPTVFSNSEDDQAFPQRKIRMCSAENNITHFLTNAMLNNVSNTYTE
jgi:hypothetical protein